MATIVKYVNSGQEGNDISHSGDDPTLDPWATIQHGVDWFRDHRQPGDTFELKLLGEFNEAVKMIGQKYSDITIETWALGGYDPDIVAQYCEARVPCGGYIATSARLPHDVFVIRNAPRVTLRNLTILLAVRGVLANHCDFLTIDNCCIHDHRDSYPGAGFAISNSSNVTVNHCFVWANRGSHGGGGYCDRCEGLAIQDTEFYTNQAEEDGGALSIALCEGVQVSGCIIGAPAAPVPGIAGPNHAKNGGGVYVYDSKTVVFRSSGPRPLPSPSPGRTMIDSNIADELGGGVFIERDTDNSDVTFEEDAEVLRNQAGESGGGIALDGKGQAGTLDVHLDRTSVHDNKALGEFGGGISMQTAFCSIQDCAISANEASWGGGGINLLGSEGDGTTLELKRGLVEANKAFIGGGIWAFGGVLRAEDSEIRENKAKSSAGGVYFSAAFPGDSLSARGCVFLKNIALFGGALVMDGNHLANSLTIFGSAFWENSVSEGGGALHISATNGSVAANFFVKNQAAQSAGAILVSSCEFGATHTDRLEIADNLFQGNTAPVAADIFAEQCPNVSVKALIQTNFFIPGPADIKTHP